MSKITTWYVWMVTYLRRNVTIVCGVSYHLLGSQISWDSMIRFWLKVNSYTSNWQLNESQHLARYVSRHNAMAYDRLLRWCLKIPWILGDSSTPWTVSQQPWQAFGTFWAAPSDRWLGGPQQCAQGIPRCSHGSRWACWGGTRQEAWSWRSGVLPWAWRCQPQERTEWAADEIAALSHTKHPSTHPGAWGRYSFWRDARVRYLAGVSWNKTSAELVGTQPLKWWLEDSQNAKKSWSQKKLACAGSTRMTDWMVWYRKLWPLAKRTTQRE